MERFSIKVICKPNNSSYIIKLLYGSKLPEFSTIAKCVDFLHGKFSIVAQNEEAYNVLIDLLGRDNLELVDPVQWREWEASKDMHCEVSLTDDQLEASEWYGNLSKKEQRYIDLLNNIWGYGAAARA